MEVSQPVKIQPIVLCAFLAALAIQAASGASNIVAAANSSKESPMVAGQAEGFDLKQRMNLAGDNLVAMINPNHHNMPNFLINVSPDGKADIEFFHVSHNVGRWVEAMVRLETATGYTIPKEIDSAMIDNIHRLFDNPDHLNLTPLDLPHTNADLFCFHSLREGLEALNVLMHHRQDAWSRAESQRMVAAMANSLLPEDQWLTRMTVWDVKKLHRYQESGLSEVLPGWSLSLVGSEGRLIEALVDNYEITGDPQALELADRFARFDMDYATRADGRFYSDRLAGHTHSYLGMLRGLLRYGELTGQRTYIERVRATYQQTIPRMIKKTGFISHNMGEETGGEVSSVGDIALLALWLGTRHGETVALDDVQRLVNARLIPAQIVESPRLEPRKAGVTGEEQRIMGDGRLALVAYPEDLGQRVIGAIGGVYQASHGGKWSTTDVTSAALVALIEIYKNIAVKTDAGLTVYLHFNYEDEQIKMTVERADAARVTVVPKVEENVLIRVPGWAPRESVRLSVNGEERALRWIGDFLFVPRQAEAKIELTYALPVSVEKESLAGVDYEITWRGDEVIGICPNTDFYPFYPTSAGCK